MTAREAAALTRRDELVAQLARARRASSDANAEVLGLRNRIHATENEWRAAEVAEVRGEYDGPPVSELRARIEADREALPEAEHRIDVADRAVRELERVIPVHYKEHAEAFVEEAEEVVAEFVRRRDEILPAVLAQLGELERLENRALSLWRPVLQATGLPAAGHTSLLSAVGSLREATRQAPRSPALGEPESDPDVVVPESGVVYLRRSDGQVFEVEAGTPTFDHLIAAGAVQVAASEAAA